MTASNSILSLFQERKRSGTSSFALLVDPDKITIPEAVSLAQKAEDSEVDYIFFGGSLVLQHQMQACIKAIKTVANIPIVLFPGSPSQVVPNADAILYLTLISGRNPELLIGQHVVSAPVVRHSGLEIISTGYMIIDGGKPTTVSYMSHSAPIPANKADIALCTAWAAEMQGKHVIYMDAGSGALNPISAQMIHKVSSQIQVPLIVGGGIKSPEQVYNAAKAGAQIVVVGNALERDQSALQEFAAATHAVANPLN